MPEKTKKKDRNLGIRATPEEQLVLKRAALEEGTTVQRFVEEAWRARLARKRNKEPEPERPSPFGKMDADEERMLAGVLNFLRHHPDAQMVGMIRGLLESAARWKPKT